MKKNIIFLVLALASTCLLTGQDGNPSSDGQRPPGREGGFGNQSGQVRPGQMESLTNAQKEQVKAILSKFDPNSLTADTAKAIHEAFRQAGLRGGPAMADTLKAAGFDPDKLRDLAPSPGQANRGDRQPSIRGGSPAQVGDNRPEPRTKAHVARANTPSSRRSRTGPN